jgi:uncharacterized protein YjlB
MQPYQIFTTPRLYFFEDDGEFPNSRLPVLIYSQVFSARGSEGSQWIMDHFAQNHWGNAWDDGIYSYHHYHSKVHEALGIYNGKALIQLGGPQGQQVSIQAGDVIVIPAGVAHKKIQGESLGVVGAYPDANIDTHVDQICEGERALRSQALFNLSHVPIPSMDPVLGSYREGLTLLWK